MNDADLETAHLQTIANRSEVLRKRGKCAHGWVEGDAPAKCKDCGKVFATFEALMEERHELIF